MAGAIVAMELIKLAVVLKLRLVLVYLLGAWRAVVIAEDTEQRAAEILCHIDRRDGCLGVELLLAHHDAAAPEIGASIHVFSLAGVEESVPATGTGAKKTDLTVVLAGVQRRGVVRLFATLLHGDLGSEMEVELSAVGNIDGKPQFIGVLIRDVGHRLPNGEASALDGLGRSLGVLNRQLGKTPLLDLVKSTVEVVERQYIAAALELTRGNRTAAAELLGLSRQSLYVKLSRYGLDGSIGAGD